MIRWLAMLRYPEGVSIEEGDRWYLGTHTQEAKQMKGLCRYLTWQAHESSWQRPGRQWHRLTELGFRDFAAWKEAQDNLPLWTPPPYGPRGFYSEAILIGDKPEYDFLQETPDLGGK